MAKDNISPEERLLNIIENGDGVSPKKETKKILFGFKSAFSKFKIFPSIGIDKLRKTQKILGGDIFHNIKLVNRILTGLTGVLTIFLIIDIAVPKRNIDKFYTSVSNLGTWQFQKRHITPLKAFSFYEEAAKEKDLFSLVVKEAVETIPEAEAKKPKLQELTKDLTLVGIYLGRYPEVMIEDRVAKKTYFLKRGDKIRGIKIEYILKDRVVLEYQGETMDFM